MKAVPKLRDRLREETENVILDAAEGVFAEQGMFSAKMDSIAVAAGVSVGTLYNYFKDRESLLNALIDARSDELVGNVSAAAETEGTFAEQLRSFVLSIFKQFVDHGPFLRILHQGEHAPLLAVSERRESSELAQRTFRRLRQVACDFFARGVRNKALRADYNPEMLATFLMGICKSTMIWQERDCGELTYEIIAPHADFVVEFFMNGASIHKKKGGVV